MTALAIRTEDRAAEAELESLRQTDSALGAELAELTAKIHAHFAFVGQQFRREVQELTALQAELAALTTSKPQAQSAPPPDAEREAPPAPNRHDRRSTSAEAKRLFRQIAQRCHPDRTDDELLHAVFLQAKDAYGRGDVETLAELRRVLGSSSVPRTADERRFMRLQVERDKLVADITAKDRTLATLRQSQEAWQVRQWESRVAAVGEAGAVAEIRTALALQLGNLRQQIQYRHAVARYAQQRQQQAAYNAYAAQSTSSTGGGLFASLFGGSPF